MSTKTSSHRSALGVPEVKSARPCKDDEDGVVARSHNEIVFLAMVTPHGEA